MAHTLTITSPEPVQHRTLGAVLARQLTERADQAAVIDGDLTWTYRELYDSALALGEALRRVGVGVGTPVLVMLDNHADFVLVWAALGLIGAVEVPVNTAYRGSILSHVVTDSGARLAIVEDGYLDRWEGHDGVDVLYVRGHAAAASTPGVTDFAELLSAQGGGPGDGPADVRAWDPMGILYTSGTTGQSKGVTAPHGLAYSYSSPEWIRAGERIAVFLPLFHIGGQWAGVYAALLAGGTAVIFERFSASTFWEDVARHGCHQTLMLGAMADFLWSQPARSSDRGHDLSHVNMVPVIREHAAFAARFGVSIGSAYGMTEFSSPVLTLYGEAEPGLAGRVRDDYEARVVDDDDLEALTGVAGEMCLRARTPWANMAGYHRLPEETRIAWRNLWFHTGDVLSRDEQGRYHFVDRKKDALRVRGENVSSFEVEAEVLQFDGVAACAVVGVPSAHTEDEIKAVIVGRDELTVDLPGLLAFLAERLPYFMVPRYFECVAALPVTPTQKVRKSELRERGVTPETWDREREGFRVTRRGVERRPA